MIDFDDGGYYVPYDVDYGEPPPKPKDSPITFVVKYHVGPSGSDLRVDHRHQEEAVRHPVRLGLRHPLRGRGHRSLQLATGSAPAKNIRYTTYGDYEANSEIVPYTKMAESAFEEFGRKIAGGFGVAVPAPVDPEETGGVVGGVYGGGRSRSAAAARDQPVACRRRSTICGGTAR